MYERFGERNLIERAEEDKAEENVSMLELKRRTKKTEIKELETKEQELKNSVSNLENELERSQKLIEAQISDFRDKRVKEIEKELESLEARKKRKEKNIEELEARNKELEDYKEGIEKDITLMRKGLKAMMNAFGNLKKYMDEWQLGKVKKEFKNAHVQQEKNDDWDMEM